MATAALTTLFALVAARRWGSIAIAFDYFLVTGVIGLAWAVAIFQRARASRASAPRQAACREAEQMGASYGL